MFLFSIKNASYKGIVHYKNINIEEGKVTFICGRSGSGKSTLLKLLNMSISVSSGGILYKGVNIDEYDSLELRKEVVLASQSVFLFDDTIKNNFKKFYSYRNENVPDDEKIKYYLSLCAAYHDLDSNCQHLSGGERQRIFIAVCLSFSPKVLLLDEPTSALDTKTSNKLIDNIIDYCKVKNITLLAVTHDRSLAKEYSDIIIDLDKEANNG